MQYFNDIYVGKDGEYRHGTTNRSNNPVFDDWFNGNADAYNFVRSFADIGTLVFSLGLTYTQLHKTPAQKLQDVANANSGYKLSDDLQYEAELQKLTESGQTPAIGKMKDFNQPGAVNDGEFKIADYLPDQGNPKDNWKQNDGILRSVMNENQPIKDVSPYPMDNAGFLGAERNRFSSEGWTYQNGYWYPPAK